ncbi:MAG: hypothetical protein WCJ31_07460 [Planctomycetia bacterium]
MTLPVHIAIVSEIPESKLPFAEVANVSAALAKQVLRDFGPIWQIQATVDAFQSLDRVPPGYWPVIVKEKLDDPDAAGYHTDKNGNPFALVQFSRSWSLTASHEVLEMLADPFGNRVVSSVSPWDNKTRVEILVEVCDPSEDDAFSYNVNGVAVSDFYTPRYLDPVTAPGVRYGFTSGLTAAREVLKGGYISFHDLSDDHWYQVTWFHTKKKLEDLGPLTAANGPIRSQIDRLTAKRTNKLSAGLTSTNATVKRSLTQLESIDAGAGAKARMWRSQIKNLGKG